MDDDSKVELEISNEEEEEGGKCGDHKDLKFTEEDTKTYDLGDFKVSDSASQQRNGYQSNKRKKYSHSNKKYNKRNKKKKSNPFLTADACKRSADVLTEIRLYKEQTVKNNTVYDEFMEKKKRNKLKGKVLDLLAEIIDIFDDRTQSIAI